VTEGGLRYQLRALYDPKRGKGMPQHATAQPRTTRSAMWSTCITDRRLLRSLHPLPRRARQRQWPHPRAELGRKRPLAEAEGLSKHLKAMLTQVTDEAGHLRAVEPLREGAMSAEAIEAVLSQKMADAVYWMDVSGKTPRRVSLHAAPINVAQGLADVPLREDAERRDDQRDAVRGGRTSEVLEAASTGGTPVSRGRFTVTRASRPCGCDARHGHSHSQGAYLPTGR
jgi:hypothetical protein